MKTIFAWRSVPIAATRPLPNGKRQWYYTGERAWLRRVGVFETFWGEVFYVNLPWDKGGCDGG